MQAKEVLTTAASLIGGDRAEQHGDMGHVHIAIATLWVGYFYAKGDEVVITPTDVANMMELLKIARRLCGEYNADDYIDAAGYAAIAAELAEPMRGTNG